jgi:hypothetical protein
LRVHEAGPARFVVCRPGAGACDIVVVGGPRRSVGAAWSVACASVARYVAQPGLLITWRPKRQRASCRAAAASHGPSPVVCAVCTPVSGQQRGPARMSSFSRDVFITCATSGDGAADTAPSCPARREHLHSLLSGARGELEGEPRRRSHFGARRRPIVHAGRRGRRLCADDRLVVIQGAGAFRALADDWPARSPDKTRPKAANLM